MYKKTLKFKQYRHFHINVAICRKTHQTHVRLWLSFSHKALHSERNQQQIHSLSLINIQKAKRQHKYPTCCFHHNTLTVDTNTQFHPYRVHPAADELPQLEHSNRSAPTSHHVVRGDQTESEHCQGIRPPEDRQDVIGGKQFAQRINTDNSGS